MRNWERWQSYRNDRGTPPWIKIHRRLLLDTDFAALTDSEKWHVIGIWIVAADRNGVIPDDKRLVKKLIGSDEEPDLDKLLSLQLLEKTGQRRRKKNVTEASQSQPDDAPKKNRRTDPPKPPRDRGDVSLIFDHWRSVMGHPKAKLGNRERKIQARLKEFSAVDICKAIDGCKLSPYHMGANDSGTMYDDLTTICRDTAQVEKFIRLADNPPRAVNGAIPPEHYRFGEYAEDHA